MSSPSGLYFYYVIFHGLFCIIYLLHFSNAETNSGKFYRAGYPEKIALENRDVECQSDEVPHWLNGIFLRQTCGAFGKQDGNTKSGESITHFLDCLGMVARFEFLNGAVKYSNKFYQTRPFQIWNLGGRDMSKSKVAWNTLFTEAENNQHKRMSNRFADFVDINPNADFRLMTANRVKAIAESEKSSYHFEPLSLSMRGNFPYTDVNFGLEPETTVFGRTTHAAVEADGTEWNTVLATVENERGSFTTKRIVYKSMANTDGTRTRTIAATIHLPELHLASADKCRADATTGIPMYTDLSGQRSLSYIHSIAATRNYIVLPASSYFYNPCQFIDDNDVPRPYYKTWMVYDDKAPAKFFVVDKKSGAYFTLTAKEDLFITHVINAFEDTAAKKPTVIVDAVIWRNEKLFTEYYAAIVQDKLEDWPQEATIARFTLVLQSTTAITSWDYLYKPTISGEFPTINQLFTGRSYQFAYIVVNPFFDDSEILKIKTEDKSYGKIWSSPVGVYAQEPVFVPRPGSTVEDDGVLLVPALDGRNQKGIVYILDAMNMTRIGQATAPDLLPFGQHGRFFTRDELEQKHVNGLSSSATEAIPPHVNIKSSIMQNIMAFFISALIRNVL